MGSSYLQILLTDHIFWLSCSIHVKTFDCLVYLPLKDRILCIYLYRVDTWCESTIYICRYYRMWHIADLVLLLLRLSMKQFLIITLFRPFTNFRMNFILVYLIINFKCLLRLKPSQFLYLNQVIMWNLIEEYPTDKITILTD